MKNLTSPGSILLKILLVVFFAEAAVMLILLLMPIKEGVFKAFFDAFLLTLLISPFIYLFVVRPLKGIAAGSKLQAEVILESALDAVITINGSGVIEMFNPAAEKIFGYRKDETVGQNVIMLMPERYREAHKKGLERVKNGGEPHIIGKVIELAGLKKGGSEFPIELSLAACECGHGGKCYIAAIRDISERKRIEAELKAHTEELERMNKLMVGRELKMVELKEEMANLKKRLGEV